MMDKPAQAKQYFEEGYNCAQAVLLPFAKELGLSEETAMLLCSSFGGGMGRLREVCGALSASFMAAGLRYGYTIPGDDARKAQHYARLQRRAARFKEDNGSLLCRDILGLPAGPSEPTPEQRTPGYYEKRPCGNLVYRAAQRLEGELGLADKDNGQD